MEYLITPEVLPKRIMNDASKQNMIDFVGAEVKKILIIEKPEMLEYYGFCHPELNGLRSPYFDKSTSNRYRSSCFLYLGV